MQVRYLALLLFLILLQARSWAVERQDQTLADGWKFIRDDVAIAAPTDQWQSVTIPHTWNTRSADAGDHPGDPHFKNGYYQGACWYARSLDIPAAWQGRRIFIRFEAASLVAKVYLNGQLLGEHRGGFTAFCYELTPSLHYGSANELRVQLDNSHQDDVPPLSGDFNIDGGIYRPVHLLVTDPVCVSPLDMASPGVYETIKSLTDSGAQVEVKTLVSNGGTTLANAQVKTEIKDAEGKVVASQTQSASVPAGQTTPVVTNLVVTAPHRWNGRKDPYLYTTSVSIISGADGGDSVVQPLGLRTVAITEDKGFLLNGQPYPIHGVDRHQDWGGQGWAATKQNYDQDMQMILDMGVTAIRLAHYPQSDYWHDLCDHNGLLLWNEVSLVNEIKSTPAFDANAAQQLRELVLQRYNHPSIAFWGIFNELHDMKDKSDPNGKKRIPLDLKAVMALLQHLKSIIEELDSSRLIVGATCVADKPFNKVPDHLCFNFYPGWYSGTVDGMTAEIEKYSTEFGKRVGISEYGAGANTTQHEEGELKQPKPVTGPFHPEEWQTYVHERDWQLIKDNPHLWGSFVWAMFDFQVAARHEGSLPDLNDKGLVTQDRKTPKDAYFFYQANWTDQPMVYIASRRMTPRRQSTTEVKVFSNCDKVELSVNGKSLGTVAPNDVKTFRWAAVTLQPGKNEIQATGFSSQRNVTDGCEWVLENAPVPNP